MTRRMFLEMLAVMLAMVSLAWLPVIPDRAEAVSCGFSVPFTLPFKVAADPPKKKVFIPFVSR